MKKSPVEGRMKRVVDRRLRYFAILTLGIIFCTGLFTSKGYPEKPADPLFGDVQGYADVLVEKVISADTFVLESGERISLIGLLSPEPTKKKKVERDKHGFIIEDPDPTKSIEQQALEYTKTLIEGKHLRLEFDEQRKNDDFRTLAYAFLPNNVFVNAEILRQGFADLRIMPPNTKYAQTLREAYREARKEKRGLQGE